MRKKWVLGVEDAAAIVAGSLAEARKNGWRVSVAVVDDGGHPVHLVRDDGAGYQTASVALRKAQTAAMNRAPTGAAEDRVKERPALLSFADRLPIRGGVPIMQDGECVGAVGVSGVQSHEDEAAAEAGIVALQRK
jgi:glc operon protein GlcG